MRTRLLAAAALLLALAGCTPTEGPAPTPTTAPTATVLNPELVPQALPAVTEQTAAVEGTRIADAVEALLGDVEILGVDDASQVAPSVDDLPPYYVVYRTYTLDPATDPLALAQTIVAVLQKSGWSQYDAVNEGGVYLGALSGGPDETPWFALIGGDASVAGQSVFTIQIASPDLLA